MKIIIHENNNIKLAEIISDKVLINDVQDALDLMADVNNKSARRIIINKNNIHPDFFKLKTGLAGEILQKFTNYNVKLAIIGDFSNYNSKSLQDFIYESNSGNQILFLQDTKSAKIKLFKI